MNGSPEPMDEALMDRLMAMSQLQVAHAVTAMNATAPVTSGYCPESSEKVIEQMFEHDPQWIKYADLITSPVAEVDGLSVIASAFLASTISEDAEPFSDEHIKAHAKTVLDAIKKTADGARPIILSINTDKRPMDDHYLFRSVVRMDVIPRVEYE